MHTKVTNPAFLTRDAEQLGLAKVRVDELIVKSGALQLAILNSANFSVIATDEKGIVQLFNAGAELMLGYEASDVVDKITPADISDPNELSARATALSKDQATPIAPGFEALVFKAARGIEDIYELTYFRKDGSRFPAIVSVTALRTDQGPIIGYLLIATDNTARKLAEEALLKAGALQRAIFDSANFSSIATDAKGVIQIFNVGAERMLGYSAAEVMNKITPADISDPNEVVARAAALSLELGTPITPGFEALIFKAARGIEDIYELTYIRKDGSRFPAVVSVTALRDAQESIIGYLLIGTDNTARKDVEDKRLWAEESFQLMVESVTDCAIIMLDEEGRVKSWNEGAQRIQGYSAKEIIGQHNSRFFSQEDIDISKPERTLQEAAAVGRSEDNGWRVRKDGSTFWANVVMTAIRDSSGALRGYATLERDMTERRRMDEELNKAKATAEAANQAKSEFLSNMSHELRTPLNAILGFAQLMESEIPPPVPAQKVSIDQILQAGWYLLALINEVLDLSLIESGRLSLSTEKVSLAEVLTDCRAMMEPLAQKRGVTMTFPEFDAPCYVLADRTRVRQILVNLLSNAIKYNRQDGSVVVSCTIRTQGYVRLCVTDTGLGLAPEKLSQLFQPFNRLGQESGVEQGTGIGLVVTKRLVEVMKGTIGVDSTVGGGTTFWIDLVATSAPRHDFTQADLSTPSQGKTKFTGPVKTVLYVEDNPANLKLVTMLVARRPDLRLLTAETGNLGVELAQAHMPDTILMDINLPGISGLKVMSILSKDSTTAHIPIIALSANANPRDIEKGLKAGFLRYLTKPIKVDELMETLDLSLAVAAAHKPAEPKVA
jgi:PAS domain S-box-containing protein